MQYSVLLVEDDPLIGQGIELGLQSRGFKLTWIDRGLRVLTMLREQEFDVLVLDLGLPDIDGIELLKKIRLASINIPIIVLTARDSIQNRITGLDHGADDYVIKPTSTDELAARIRAATRRSSGRSSETMLSGKLELNLLLRELKNEGQAVLLTPNEFLIIEILIRKKGQVVHIEAILNALEGSAQDSTPQAIQVHIHRLRKKLGATTIGTVRGVGYRLE